MTLWVPLCRQEAAELAEVIKRMQKNADQVEKNILQAEEMLRVVRKQPSLKLQIVHRFHISPNFLPSLCLKCKTNRGTQSHCFWAFVIRSKPTVLGFSVE